MMRKRLIPTIIALGVTLLFLLPGLALGKGNSGHGNGTPSPPPSNPPCDSDGHNGQPPPYGGPNLHSLTCKLQRGTGNGTGNGTTGNACPPASPGFPAIPPPGCGHGSTSTTGSSSTTTGSSSTTTTTAGETTSGAGDECTWDINLGQGALVIPGTAVEGLIGIHVDLPAGTDLHPNPTPPIGLIHACVGLGSVVGPDSGGTCPNGTVPIEAQPDDTSGLLLCVLL
jgi:hypothetical protein